MLLVRACHHWYYPFCISASLDLYRVIKVDLNKKDCGNEQCFTMPVCSSLMARKTLVTFWVPPSKSCFQFAVYLHRTQWPWFKASDWRPFRSPMHIIGHYLIIFTCVFWCKRLCRSILCHQWWRWFRFCPFRSASWKRLWLVRARLEGGQSSGPSRGFSFHGGGSWELFSHAL